MNNVKNTLRLSQFYYDSITALDALHVSSHGRSPEASDAEDVTEKATGDISGDNMILKLADGRL